MAQLAPPQVASHGGARPQTKSFAAETAAITGESKSQVNRHVAHAEALGDDIDRLTGTSLDKGVEIDALAKLPESEPDPRKPLAWLIEELGLPVGAEALRLRAKAEGWEKGGAVQPKLAKPKHVKAKPKLGKKKTNLGKLEEGKPRKPTHTPVNPGKCDVSLAGEVAALQKLARPDLDGTKLPW